MYGAILNLHYGMISLIVISYYLNLAQTIAHHSSINKMLTNIIGMGRWGMPRPFSGDKAGSYHD
jgi:hypothetical protein